MSRIGRMPIPIPQNVKVTINQNEVTIAGAKGELRSHFNPDMAIKMDGNNLVVSRPSDSREHRSLHGLTRTLLANMVTGVSTGFQKTLEIVGVGFRAEKSGEKLVLRVGFSHTVEVVPMPGISFGVERANRIVVSGMNKEYVGEMAARIKAIRPPDAYKGKGIRYAGEIIRLKPGKTGKAIAKTGA